ncbi:MAG: hypothetical protein WC718_10610 [Phycisphaerales bacterium]|jgi:hypothetical protein
MMTMCWNSVVLLMQTKGRAGGPTQPVVFWVIALLAIALVGGALILVVRRQLFAKDADQAGQGTMMESLRAMRDAGQISSAEYDTMRRNMVEAIRSSTPRGKGNPAPPTTITAPLRPLPPPTLPPTDRIAKPGFDLTGAPLPKPPTPPPPTPPK